MAKPRKPKEALKKKPKTSAETPEQDIGLWRTVAKSVIPLKYRDLPPEEYGAKPPVKGPATPPPAFVAAPTARQLAASVSLAVKLPVAPAALPDLTHSAQPGLDKATVKRMRRGKVSVSARIDLHGMTQAEAHPALDAFLEAAWYAGKREVLVITGKGTRADGSIGVLREQVPRWLNAFPNRAKVVAFQYASPKDGGEGALYVRLKKR